MKEGYAVLGKAAVGGLGNGLVRFFVQMPERLRRDHECHFHNHGPLQCFYCIERLSLELLSGSKLLICLVHWFCAAQKPVLVMQPCPPSVRQCSPNDPGHAAL